MHNVAKCHGHEQVVLSKVQNSNQKETIIFMLYILSSLETHYNETVQCCLMC